MVSSVAVSPRGERRLESRHPWIYRADITDVRAEPGDIVLVRGSHPQVLGHALYSSTSQIALRMLSYGEEPADHSLIERRIRSAAAYRDTLGIDATAYRLVHGEADLLPSLVVDRYGDHLVVQALSQGMDRLLPVITATLNELTHPLGILARNDPRTRLLEGLAREVKVLSGSVPQALSVSELGMAYDVDLWRGQKTGLF